jgi:hypothetical protein
MAKHWSSAQPDLFEEPPQGMRLGAAERAMAVEQLQVLLTEAMATLSDRRETGDDQDHA